MESQAILAANTECSSSWTLSLNFIFHSQAACQKFQLPCCDFVHKIKLALPAFVIWESVNFWESVYLGLCEWWHPSEFQQRTGPAWVPLLEECLSNIQAAHKKHLPHWEKKDALSWNEQMNNHPNLFPGRMSFLFQSIWSSQTQVNVFLKTQTSYQSKIQDSGSWVPKSAS